MDIDINILSEKYENCVKALEDGITCATCKYIAVRADMPPCNECYSVVLGFPVNPTKWEELERK